MCEVLFDPKLLSLDTARLFDERYKSRVVQCTGRLTSVDSYPFDFVFGSEPGTKATLEIHELDDSLYGKKVITAVVQLPPEACEVLTPTVGQDISIEGSLHSVDGFVQNIYMTQGALRVELAT